MGGYGLYVWGSFGMCSAALVLEQVLLALRRRALTAHGTGQTVDFTGPGA